MNKWAMRAVGGAACTVGALAFTTGVSHADGTNSHSPHHNKSAHKAAFSKDSVRRPLSEKTVKTIEHAAKSTGLTADRTGASKKTAHHPRHAASKPVHQAAGSVVKAATDTVNDTTHIARHAATPVVDHAARTTDNTLKTAAKVAKPVTDPVAKATAPARKSVKSTVRRTVDKTTKPVSKAVGSLPRVDIPVGLPTGTAAEVTPRHAADADATVSVSRSAPRHRADTDVVLDISASRNGNGGINPDPSQRPGRIVHVDSHGTVDVPGVSGVVKMPVETTSGVVHTTHVIADGVAKHAAHEITPVTDKVAAAASGSTDAVGQLAEYGTDTVTHIPRHAAQEVDHAARHARHTGGIIIDSVDHGLRTGQIPDFVTSALHHPATAPPGVLGSIDGSTLPGVTGAIDTVTTDLPLDAASGQLPQVPDAGDALGDVTGTGTSARVDDISRLVSDDLGDLETTIITSLPVYPVADAVADATGHNLVSAVPPRVGQGRD